ncbi:MAG: hypothetical protein COC16_04330 [Lutibacter sp.]|nr:MAG: hypothetical protein COC16_04330 [Lutibacter sp.]
MPFLKKILNFYIFSNIHVSIAGFCLTKITLFKFGIVDNLTPFFVLFSIIISYNFIRFFEIKKERLNWFKKWFFEYRYLLLILSILSILGLGYIIFFTKFNFNSFVILFPFAFMTFFYVLPLFKIGNIEVSFRNFPSIKIISIALAWAGITVFFPLFDAGYEFTSSVYIEFIQRFLILISITIPFDIRDVSVDPRSLKTLPQLVGVGISKIIGYLLLLVVVLLEFYMSNVLKTSSYILIAIALITMLFLAFSTLKRNRYYTSFWVEAIPILWFTLIVVFSQK